MLYERKGRKMATTKTSRIVTIIIALMVMFAFTIVTTEQVNAASGPKAPSKVSYKIVKDSNMGKAIKLKWTKVKGAKGYQVKYRVREYWYEGQKNPVPQKWSKWKTKRVKNKKHALKRVLGYGSASTDAKIQVKIRSCKIKNGKRVYGSWKRFKKKYIKRAFEY